MKRISFMMTALLLCFCMGARADNVVTISSTEGAPGDEVTVSIGTERREQRRIMRILQLSTDCTKVWKNPDITQLPACFLMREGNFTYILPFMSFMWFMSFTFINIAGSGSRTHIHGGFPGLPFR